MVKQHKVVIDANIAFSSGKTEHPVSKACREALDNIAKNNHHFVLCKTLLAEWKRHQSNYAAKWLASMFARRQVELITHGDQSKEKIISSKVEERYKNAALKDSHLVDAACVRGRFITSSDDRAREAFAAIPELKSIGKVITWINPVTESDMLEKVLNEKIEPSKFNKICL